MKKRILFVDDEPQILEGLRCLLRRKRRKWDMSFAVGGQAGVDLIDSGDFDVVVSDMRMPGVDGAALLQHVQDRHPEVVRIVLSGYSELEAAMRAVPVAHQFLSKPCDPVRLESTVERACDLQALISDEVLRRMVGKIDRLPSRPQVYDALTTAMSDEQSSAADIAGILKQDMAMCAKLLQLVNSAFFRVASRITSIDHAVAYLGFNMIKNLVLSVEVFTPTRRARKIEGLSLEDLQRHALATASLARQLLPGKEEAADAFMAGMLHDIGKLVLASELPGHMREVLALSRERKVPHYVIERELTGVTHAEVGGYLLGLWGLPYPVIEAVANHHAPGRVAAHGFDVLGAVHVANALVHEQMDKGISGELSQLDLPYLFNLGVESRLSDWAEMAQRTVG